MKNIGVIGTGYVGLVTAGCLAELGHTVTCVDNDRSKVNKLKKGVIPFFEPGLDELVSKHTGAGRLSFISSIRDATDQSEVIFICVGTPSRADGSADLSAVEKVASEIARAMKGYKVVIEKSTVPAETGVKIRRTIEMTCRQKADFDVVSNPEFLREGQALHDALHPDRIVVGVESPRAEKVMRELYRPFKAPIIVCNIETAEIIKHACNSFLATKISFINAVAHLCERVGADVTKVAEAMGLDKRIGKAFLSAGAGYGGSCFPKDVDAFIHLAHQKGYDFELIKAVRRINDEQRRFLFKKIEDALWNIKDKTIGVLGLSFKPDTDDIRNSVAFDMIGMLQHAGAKIRAYDPKAMTKAKAELASVVFCKDAYQTATGSHCLLIMTEWDEFGALDWRRVKKALRQPVVVDSRNMLDPETMKSLGFTYHCIGRGI